jgi:hypothetical protein
MKYKYNGSSRQLSSQDLAEIMSNSRKMSSDSFGKVIKPNQLCEATGLDKKAHSISLNKTIKYYKSSYQKKPCYFVSAGGIIYLFTETK